MFDCGHVFIGLICIHFFDTVGWIQGLFQLIRSDYVRFMVFMTSH